MANAVIESKQGQANDVSSEEAEKVEEADEAKE